MSREDFKLPYELSPIFFVDGIAANIPGAILPIISITQGSDFADGILSSGDQLDLNNYNFNFQPLPGATLAANQLGEYPFANQAVAANAIIAQPTNISLLMLAPARGDGAYGNKVAVFQALVSAITQHTALGGTYNVATPSYLYLDLILTALQDVSDGDPKRVQDHWRWDFRKPLLSLQDAQAAQNNLMTKLSNQTPVTPNKNGTIVYSGPAVGVGNPGSGQGGSVVPAQKTLGGASAASASPTSRSPGSPGSPS